MYCFDHFRFEVPVSVRVPEPFPGILHKYINRQKLSKLFYSRPLTTEKGKVKKGLLRKGTQPITILREPLKLLG